jgi:acetyl-CoA carboxylase, biotin carboxylase subunit
VEHPVTEMATGLDLVELQLRVAAGEALPFRQEDVQWRGSAIECRVYAEDPEQNFLPSPGTITRWAPPSGPYVRMDSGVYPGWTVPTYYDPMLAKLAVWAPTRELAVARLRTALAEFEIVGIRSNLAFFREVLDDEAFQRGELHTGFIPEFFARRPAPEPDPVLQDVGRAVMAEVRKSSKQRHRAEANERPSRWLAAGRSESLR